MFEAIQTVLQSNQLFAGGIVLGAFGMAGAFVGRLGQGLLQGLTARLFPSITLDHRSPLYGYVQAWLQDHPYTRSCRSVTAMRRESPENGEVRLVPGDGSHLLRHRRGWIWLQRSRQTGRSNRSGEDRETLQIHVLALQRQALTDLIGDIIASHGPRADTLALYGVSTYGDWNELGRIGHRSLDSVIVASGLESMLLEDARRFLASRSWYADRGVPWRRGYLLHGQPGTGKTSLIRALASELGLDLALLDLSKPDLDDAGLRDLVAQVPRNVALVLEDIDAVAPGREDNDRKLTLSGLLNALDGLGASEGRLLYMTTNHPEALDPALIRPGRVDHAVEIAPLAAEDAGRMVARFFPDHPDLPAKAVQALGERRMPAAELQGVLLNNALHPENVVKVLAASVSGD